MNYRNYDEGRELIEKHLRDSKSEFEWVVEISYSHPNSLSDEDNKQVNRIYDLINELYNKLKDKK